MLRFGAVFGLALCLCGPSIAFAQQPGQGPPMPIAVDLAKVPAGSAAGNTIETSLEGGMMAAAGKMVMQMMMTPGADPVAKKTVMQIGAGDPMDLPVAMTGEKPFTKPNNKGLVGSETLKVAGGSFKAKHYRDKSPQGDKIDYWISDSVLPLGLVKVEVDQKSNPQIKGKVSLELAAMGKDAKPAITKPPKPFDQAALMQQMMSAAGAGAGAGAKPAPPPAAPAPAAPKK